MASVAAEIAHSDADLVTAAKRGDRLAFESLVFRYHAPLLHYLARLTGDPDLAADLAQDAFIRAFSRLKQLDRTESFPAWLYTIALNGVRMERRRRPLARFISFEWLPEALLEAIPALQSSEESDACIERDLIQGIIDNLTPDLAHVFLLNIYAGFTSGEIATILAITPAAAARRLSRAKLAFRERYLALIADTESHSHDPV